MADEEKIEEPKKEETWEPNPAFIEMDECFKYLDEQIEKETKCSKKKKS